MRPDTERRDIGSNAIKSILGTFKNDLRYAILHQEGKTQATEVQNVFEPIGDMLDLGYDIRFAEEPYSDTSDKIRRLCNPSYAHNYSTVVWIKAKVVGSEPVFLLYYCRISKMTLSRYRLGARLSFRERSEMNNFPLKIFNGTRILTKLNGPYGDRPMKIQRPLLMDSFLGVIVGLKNGLVIPDPSHCYRLTSGKNASLLTMQRNANKFDKGVSDQYIIKHAREYYSNVNVVNFPEFPDYNIPALINSAETRPDKFCGAISRMENGTIQKKEKYIAPCYHVAHELAEKFEKGEKILDSSIYSEGGRNKNSFNKPNGAFIRGRPVWMAHMVGEFFVSHITDEFQRYASRSGTDFPIYLGKGLILSGWENLFEVVSEPTRTCYHGDYSGWDSTVYLGLIRVAISMLRAMFPNTRKWSNFWTFVYSNISRHPIITLGGFVVSFQCGLPSGHRMTSVMNSLCNMLITPLHANKAGVMKQLAKIRKDTGRNPVCSCVQGDDFSTISLDSKADALVQRMGSVASAVASDQLGMELDPPYIGDFGVKDPETGSFEFLRVGATDKMEPTIKGLELLRRCLLNETESTALDPERKKSVFEFPPQHEKGIRVYKTLKYALYLRTGIRNPFPSVFGQIQKVSMSNSKIVQQVEADLELETQRVWSNEKKTSDPLRKGKVSVLDYVMIDSSYGDDKLGSFSSRLNASRFSFSGVLAYKDFKYYKSFKQRAIRSYLHNGIYCPAYYVDFL
jgi:hypothetical protein